MIYLITGGCGFLGSNIAAELIKQNNKVIVFDNLSRYGSAVNLEWLKSFGIFEFVHGDIRNINDIDSLVKKHTPDVIFHLAGQVAMTTSIANPQMDFEVNTGGTFALLNAVRRYSPNSTVIYSSTNKVYGDLMQFTYTETQTRYECVEKPNGFDETVNLNFHSPYGTSKGSADQYMLDFARIYGLKTVVFRHSSMYGGRQFATVDQGWIGWFVQQALKVKNNTINEKITISGNGKQVRDLLFASDCVQLYLKAADNIDAIKGQAFNIGGGIENSCSILELFSILEEALQINISVESLPPRQSDQLVFVSDITNISNALGWVPKIDKRSGIDKMISWVSDNEK